MNFRYSATLIIFALFGQASANCDILASVIDNRDRAVTFDPQQNVMYRPLTTEGGIGRCKLNINSFGLPNPKSSFYADYSNLTNSFDRDFIISKAMFKAPGMMTFAKINFLVLSNGGYTTNHISYQLELSISPGTQLTEKNSFSPSYVLSGNWNVLNEDGTLQSSTIAFSAQEVAVGDTPTVQWRSSRNPIGATEIKTLDINFATNGYGSNVARIFDYSSTTSQYTGHKDFYPNSETIGDLKEYGLAAQKMTFTLDGSAVCANPPSAGPVLCK
jgi:hypothetical protein